MHDVRTRVTGRPILLCLIAALLPTAARAQTTPAPPTVVSTDDKTAATELAQIREELAAWARLDVGGYVQGRYEWHDDANYGLDSSKSP